MSLGEVPGVVPGFSIDRLAAVQGIFSSTSCYELMQTSYKVIVFETTIPFQLAFYALVEHDADIAPLWDPCKRGFVAMMTMNDYVRSLSVCLDRNIPMIELSSKSIADMLSSPLISFQHSCFDPLDADESILQLVQQLDKSNADFVPIINTEDGSLVSILGYLDIIHLLDLAAKQHPTLFSESIADLEVGRFQNLIVVNKSTRLHDAVQLLEEHKISGVPVIDEGTGTVCSYFHKSEVSFITRANDPDNILPNLCNMTVGDILIIRSQIHQSGDQLPVTSQSLLTATLTDSISSVLSGMMQHRVTKVVMVDSAATTRCIGVVSIKDILKYYVLR